MAGKSEQTEQALTDSVTQAEQALTALGGVVEGEVSLGGLPEEYLLVDLGEVAFVNSGVGFPKKYQGNTDGEYPVYKVGDVSKAFLNAEGKLAKAGHYVSSDIAAEMKGKVFPVGATAFAKIGEAVRLNRRALIQRAGLADNNVMIVKADLSSMDLYVYQFLRTQSLDDVTQSTTVPSVRKGDIENLEIPLPPLAEQTVIAQTLDTLLAQVDNIKTRLDSIPKILKTFRQSVLAAAVSGKLTEEWRGSDSIDFSQSPITIGAETDCAPKGWGWKKLIDLATLESGHTPRKSVPEYWEGGNVPWISLQDIRAAHGTIINKTKHMPTPLGIDNSSARLLPKGTVCFSRDISVGYTTIMGNKMSTTQHFANWVCGKGLNNKYLMYSLMAAKQHLLLSGQGTTVKTIYMPALKEFQIILPELKEQTKIVSRVEELFAFAGKIEQQVKNAQGRVNNLTQSILAKAFRGELTTQWRALNPQLISGENSAAALLAAIKKEREELESVKKSSAKKTIKKRVAVSKNKAASEPLSPDSIASESQVELVTGKKPKAVVDLVSATARQNKQKKASKVLANNSQAAPSIESPETDIQWAAFIRSNYKKSNPDLTLDELMAHFVQALPIKRLSPQRKALLEQVIKKACKWQVLYKESGEYCLYEVQFADYDNEALDTLLPKLLRKGSSIPQDDLYREYLQGLGFKRGSPKAEERFKNYLRSARRRKLLKREGDQLRRV